MKVRIRPTEAQEQSVSLVRRELALRGYYIFPVAEWYCRNSLDFVAVPKNTPQCLVLVRPVGDGTVSVRPFAMPTLYESVRTLLKSLGPKFAAPVRFSNRQLPFSNIRPDWWDQYLSEASRREYTEIS